MKIIFFSLLFIPFTFFLTAINGHSEISAENTSFEDFSKYCDNYEQLTDDDLEDLVKLVLEINRKTLQKDTNDFDDEMLSYYCNRFVNEIKAAGIDATGKKINVLMDSFQKLSVKRSLNGLGKINDYLQEKQEKMGCTVYQDEPLIKNIKEELKNPANERFLYDEKEKILELLDIDLLRQPEVRSLLFYPPFIAMIKDLLKIQNEKIDEIASKLKTDVEKRRFLLRLKKLKALESLVLTFDFDKENTNKINEEKYLRLVDQLLPDAEEKLRSRIKNNFLKNSRIDFDIEDGFNKLLSIQISKKNNEKNNQGIYLLPEERAVLRTLFRQAYTMPTGDDKRAEFIKLINGVFEKSERKNDILQLGLLASEVDSNFWLTKKIDLGTLPPPPPPSIANSPSLPSPALGVSASPNPPPPPPHVTLDSVFPADDESEEGSLWTDISIPSFTGVQPSSLTGFSTLPPSTGVSLSQDGDDDSLMDVSDLDSLFPEGDFDLSELLSDLDEDDLDEDVVASQKSSDKDLEIPKERFNYEIFENEFKRCQKKASPKFDERGMGKIEGLGFNSKFKCLGNIFYALKQEYKMPEKEDSDYQNYILFKKKLKDEIKNEVYPFIKAVYYGGYSNCLNNFTGTRYLNPNNPKKSKKTKEFNKHEKVCEETLGALVSSGFLNLKFDEVKSRPEFKKLKLKKKLKCVDFLNAKYFLHPDYGSTIDKMVEDCDANDDVNKSISQKLIGNFVLMGSLNELTKTPEEVKRGIDENMQRELVIDAFHNASNVDKMKKVEGLISMEIFSDVIEGNLTKNRKESVPVKNKFVRKIDLDLEKTPEGFLKLIFDKYEILNEVSLSDNIRKGVTDKISPKLDLCQGKKKDDETIYYVGMVCPELVKMINKMIDFKVEEARIVDDLNVKLVDDKISLEEKLKIFEKNRLIVLQGLLKGKNDLFDLDPLRKIILEKKKMLNKIIENEKKSDFKNKGRSNLELATCTVKEKDSKGFVEINLSNIKNKNKVKDELIKKYGGIQKYGQKNSDIVKVKISNLEFAGITCDTSKFNKIKCFELKNNFIALEVAKDNGLYPYLRAIYNGKESDAKLFESQNYFVGDAKVISNLLNNFNLECE